MEEAEKRSGACTWMRVVWRLVMWLCRRTHHGDAGSGLVVGALGDGAQQLMRGRSQAVCRRA